ncbi:hypothetical protein [Marinomonas foliarum]|uniref:Uncharacterized protein n=1 Tax=Marinomonas foliarum TaxID=491950 RepID=A0A369AC18_9GAMM|nr:hypothetical protein [Marinomonas foliarum]RCX06691.1 hypothetical protein DFP77_10987 [Marinomonas foliarum]
MQNTNSASRILSILKEATEHGENENTLEVWVAVFKIDESNSSKKDIEVARYLRQMHDEIEYIQDEMKLDEYDEFKCKFLLGSITNALTVKSLSEPWRNVKNKLIQVAVFLCLGYCRQCLPDEENTINPEDIDDIKSQILALQSSLEASSLSKGVQKMIQNHLNEILTSLSSCRISGSSSLQGTMDAVIGEVIRKKEMLKEEKDRECLSMYTKVLDTVGKVTDGLIKSEKVISAAAKIGTQVTKALEHIN